MSKKVAIILINYKDYAKKYLSECLEGLREQDYAGHSRLFIVDNASSDESSAYLKEMVPEAEIICNKNNDGFAKGNNDAIRMAMALDYDYVILLNMDTIITKNCVSEMVKAAEADKKIGAVQARLMLHPEKELINSLGNTSHFLGFGYCLGYREKMDEKKMKVANIMYPSGAAVLFPVSALREVGLLDEVFWMYNEDQDLGWRLWLAGYSCILAPTAVVYHKYEFSKSISKYYWMDRNRILAIWKNYRLITLVLIFPAFVIMELGLLLFAIKGGWLKEKFKVWGYFLRPATWLYIIKARASVQVKRKVNDYELLPMFSGRIWYQEVDDWKLRAVNPVFAGYFWLVKNIIKLLRA
ncbi:MAG: glycosyltransferase family 2 protein [Candidatus Falkowbacteria bacterium]